VQLYVSHPGVANAPVRSLKGFQRIPLKHGESKEVSFTLTAEDLSLIDERGNRYQPEGKTVFSIGGGQPGIDNAATGNVLSKAIMIQ
jgi:beta-glucosidase